MRQLRQIEPEQRGRPQEPDPERPVGQHRGTDNAAAGGARQQQRIEPREDADASARQSRRARSPAARTDRRKRPAQAGRRPRMTEGRWPRAARRRPSDNKDRPAPGSGRSRSCGCAAAVRRHRPCRSRVRDRRFRKNGTTRSFDTMIASATNSTITIAVAADRPPMKAAMVNNDALAESGSASTNMSLSTWPAGKVSRPASAIGTTNRLISTR